MKLCPNTTEGESRTVNTLGKESQSDTTLPLLLVRMAELKSPLIPSTRVRSSRTACVLRRR